jgi:hypothetical protein
LLCGLPEPEVGMAKGKTAAQEPAFEKNLMEADRVFIFL